MKTDILIPLVIIIGCIVLIIIKNDKQENFKSEYRESDIFLPNPVPTFISTLQNKKDLIITKDDKNNTFPIEDYELKIVPPKPYDGPIKKDEPYKDVTFIRDDGVNKAMKNNIKKDDKDYEKVINSYMLFSNPKNSNDFLTSIDYKTLSKEELDNSLISDIYNKMSVRVVNDISKDQIDIITGKPIDPYNNYNDSSQTNISNYYKPVLTLIDKNLEYNNNLENIDYKYLPYVEPPIGSLLK